MDLAEMRSGNERPQGKFQVKEVQEIMADPQCAAQNAQGADQRQLPRRDDEDEEVERDPIVALEGIKVKGVLTTVTKENSHWLG